MRTACSARLVRGAGLRGALRAAGLVAALLLGLPVLAGAEDYGCLESSRVSCLQDGRFKVRAYYDHEENQNRSARIRDALVGDAASLFYFFTFDNPELMVKVVDGCALNGRYWVFGSAATDLDYRVTVEDKATGREKRYERNRSNPLIGDVVSFPCAIPEGAAARASAKSGVGRGGGSSWRTGGPGRRPAPARPPALRRPGRSRRSAGPDGRSVAGERRSGGAAASFHGQAPRHRHRLRLRRFDH